MNVNKITECDVQELGQEICSLNPQIIVTGTNPIPSSFPASQTPIVVILDAGVYSVNETGFQPGLAQCAGFDGGQQIGDNIYTCTDFGEDCSGNINAGESLSCTIENNIIETATLIVTKRILCAPTGVTSERACQAIRDGTGFPLGQITPNEFNIAVTNTNPNPSQFDGAPSPGVVVTLSPGAYTVTETTYPSVDQAIAAVENQFGVDVLDATPSFTSDCGPQGTGTISAGETQECEITNTFSVIELGI